MIAHQMTLNYALNPGWMGPFVDGLKEGRAMAKRCAACKATSFPPVRVCACGALESAWVQLSGAAEILFRTTGTDGDFGLVQFDGATSKTTLRLVGVGPGETHGRILASDGPRPALQLTSNIPETP